MGQCAKNVLNGFTFSMPRKKINIKIFLNKSRKDDILYRQKQDNQAFRSESKYRSKDQIVIKFLKFIASPWGRVQTST